MTVDEGKVGENYRSSSQFTKLFFHFDKFQCSSTVAVVIIAKMHETAGKLSLNFCILQHENTQVELGLRIES